VPAHDQGGGQQLLGARSRPRCCRRGCSHQGHSPVSACGCGGGAVVVRAAEGGSAGGTPQPAEQRQQQGGGSTAEGPAQVHASGRGPGCPPHCHCCPQPPVHVGQSIEAFACTIPPPATTPAQHGSHAQVWRLRHAQEREQGAAGEPGNRARALRASPLGCFSHPAPSLAFNALAPLQLCPLPHWRPVRLSPLLCPLLRWHLRT